MRGVLTAILLAFLLAANAAMIGGWWLGHKWPFELLTHLTPLLIAVLLLSLAGWLVLKTGKARLLVTVASLPAIAYGITHFLSVKVQAPDAFAGGNALTIYVANVKIENTDPTALLRQIANRKPDTILLIEPSPAFFAAVSAGLSQYQFQIKQLAQSPFSIALLSRVPATGSTIVYNSVFRSIDARVCPVPDRCLNIIGVHPPPPFNTSTTVMRDNILGSLGALAVARNDAPLIIAGDLNTTQFSPAYGKHLTANGLRSRNGYSFLSPSWFSRIPFLGLRIDDVLANKRVKILDVSVEPDIGSDHFPVFAKLAF